MRTAKTGHALVTSAMDTSPQTLNGPGGWFKRAIATLLMLSITVSSFAQVTAALIRGSDGQPVSGFGT